VYKAVIEALAPYEFYIGLAAVVCSFVSAGFWIRASLVRTPRELWHAIHMPLSGPMQGDLGNLVEGVYTQSRWNSRAALFAAMASVLTGVTLLIGVRWG
jgi:hypothetical protein